ncbi:MAG: MAPEG family protein [Gammaproteobacteria bacterium]|nr:MAPEG family protein [Gammaproteobacteria bacterium]
MHLVYLVILVALAEYLLLGVLVARARGRYQVAAPAVTGHPEFERCFRVQQNTLEQLIVVIPAMWIFGLTLSPLWSAILGLVFVLGRGLYAYGYLRHPARRHHGFTLGFIATLALLAGGLLGTIKALL